MNTFRRWTAGVFSRIDMIVAQVENHEALVNQALRELQQATARAHVQLKRVQRDGEQMRRQLADAQEASIQWKERAKRTVDDEKRALECLKRSKRAKRAVQELDRRVAEHERIEQQLAADVRGLEERLDKLKEQRNLMRTRQSRAEAMGVVQGGKIEIEGQIDEVFDRWEMRVTESEYAGGVTLSSEDRFEDDFVSEEEADELRAELDELRREDDE